MMALIRLFMVTVALSAVVSVDSYAGCGVSRSVIYGSLRSQVADIVVDQKDLRKEMRKKRAALDAVENLNLHLTAQKQDVANYKSFAIRLSEFGNAIVKYNIDFQVIRALVERGIDAQAATHFVRLARRKSSGSLG